MQERKDGMKMKRALWIKYCKRWINTEEKRWQAEWKIRMKEWYNKEEIDFVEAKN